MSRVGAGILGVATTAMGAALGAGVALQIHGDKVAFGPMLPREQKTAAKGAAIGGLLGAAIGAALGAGSDQPKQLGVSGLQREWGLGAEITAPTMINPGEIWQIDIASDSPVSSQQFFDLVSSFQGEMAGKFKTLSFAAIDQTHFRTIVQFLTPQLAHAPGDPSDSEVVDGIKFTIGDMKPYVALADTTSGTQTVVDKKKLSTGEIVGITAAGATALGGIIYVATRKPKRRRRR